MTDLKAVKKRLEQEKKELITRLERCEADLQHRDAPPEKDFAELATERENDEVLEALAQSSREELKKINQALVRVEEGLYSICSHCGEDIPEERLDAVPYTTHCVHCAEQRS